MIIHQQSITPQFSTDTKGVSLTINFPAIHDSGIAEWSPRSSDFFTTDYIIDDLMCVQEI